MGVGRWGLAAEEEEDETGGEGGDRESGVEACGGGEGGGGDNRGGHFAGSRCDLARAGGPQPGLTEGVCEGRAGVEAAVGREEEEVRQEGRDADRGAVVPSLVVVGGEQLLRDALELVRVGPDQ